MNFPWRLLAPLSRVLVRDYSVCEGIVEESFNRGSYLGARGSDAPSVPSIIFRMSYFPSLSVGV